LVKTFYLVKTILPGKKVCTGKKVITLFTQPPKSRKGIYRGKNLNGYYWGLFTASLNGGNSHQVTIIAVKMTIFHNYQEIRFHHAFHKRSKGPGMDNMHNSLLVRLASSDVGQLLLVFLLVTHIKCSAKEMSSNDNNCNDDPSNGAPDMPVCSLMIVVQVKANKPSSPICKLPLPVLFSLDL
jgi:hypothetical protein